jgi:hypothetical protein
MFLFSPFGLRVGGWLSGLQNGPVCGPGAWGLGLGWAGLGLGLGLLGLEAGPGAWGLGGLGWGLGLACWGVKPGQPPGSS